MSVCLTLIGEADNRFVIRTSSIKDSEKVNSPKHIGRVETQRNTLTMMASNHTTGIIAGYLVLVCINGTTITFNYKNDRSP